MVQLGGPLKEERRSCLLQGDEGCCNESYDANLIRRFSVASLPKDPPPRWWNMFDGGQDTRRIPPGVQHSGKDGSRILSVCVPSPRFHNTHMDRVGDETSIPQPRNDDRPNIEGYWLVGNNSSQGASSVVQRAHGDASFRSIKPPSTQHPAGGAPITGEGPSRKVSKRKNSSSICRAEYVLRIPRKSQHQSSRHEKEAARAAHTISERQRRLRISAAIKQIGYSLDVGGSKVEILESAAEWIDDAKSKEAEQP
ncbi:MAG: hypothetical protein Q9219_005810 [cf. Caloplaca sp. 3 TL-2023]